MPNRLRSRIQLAALQQLNCQPPVHASALMLLTHPAAGAPGLLLPAAARPAAAAASAIRPDPAGPVPAPAWRPLLLHPPAAARAGGSLQRDMGAASCRAWVQPLPMPARVVQPARSSRAEG